MSGLLVIVGDNVLLPDDKVPRPATVVVDLTSGKITTISPSRASRSSFPENVQWIDAGSKYVLPGLVDSHVHLNEPGRTDWEGFWTGTRAAASGGVTTVVDMPLNSIPPTVTASNLQIKRDAAYNQCFTDVAFWGGVIPNHQNHLKPLVDAGVKGFKCFLIESGVEEFPCVVEEDLKAAMDVLQDLPTTLLFHAELEHPSHEASPAVSTHPTLYSTFLASRPQTLEVDAISLVTRLQKSYPRLRCHIVHLSAASALPLVREAKASGVNLTVETCFHYLCLAADSIPDGQPQFKCCPPVREEGNRQLLWDALLDGTIDCVVSDHSPCVAELKKLDKGDIMEAWGGISTLGLGLSLLWTEGRKRGVGIGKIIDWTSKKSAQHASLDHVKGALKVGYDADIIIWDADAQFTVTKESLNFKNKLSPYEGQTLFGTVEKTLLRGHVVYDKENGFTAGTPIGKLL
ncbi:allantoinase [Cylindrobasidium torrendii FP15055 ss-10]|uniref:allantoinase n=1 Tax=Cylindrobasidium torrendii FP15055 ss-10 TaxID=1314674 RepID=A0A0D7BR72_9AGAR|nr:allantoinase [Cylindrobasidium torrendii FP15055 ss-10]